jgi:methanogenic corrinoid protein MtbC1
MIDEKVYQRYVAALLAGRRSECREIVEALLAAGVPIRQLYTGLFQRSMYRVGELWETNIITVGNEQLATSITEGLLTLIYPKLFASPRSGKRAVISCSANEYHQIGGKMVADLLELNGWDCAFHGAGTAPDVVLESIQETKPDAAGLSLGILSHLDGLTQMIERMKTDFPQLDLLVGGQAFAWGGVDVISRYRGVEYISGLDDLERKIGAGQHGD